MRIYCLILGRIHILIFTVACDLPHLYGVSLSSGRCVSDIVVENVVKRNLYIRFVCEMRMNSMLKSC